MRNFSYAAVLTPQPEGGFTVTFRDIPEAITQGDDRAEALVQASDCLDEAIASRIIDAEDIPDPSRPRPREVLVSVPAPMAAKAALYLALRDAQEAGDSISSLARRLKVTQKEIRRMLDPKHPTKLTRIEAVLGALGKRLVIGLDSAA